MPFRPPPRDSMPRTPHRDDQLSMWLLRPTSFRSVDSRARRNVPYIVTLAVCACAANGDANAPATARAITFLFIESLLYQLRLARRCVCQGKTFSQFREVVSILPNLASHWQDECGLEASLWVAAMLLNCNIHDNW